MSDRSQKTSSGEFVLKKARTSLTKDSIVRFLDILNRSDLKQNYSRIDYPFSSIFENIPNKFSSTQYFTIKNRSQLEEGENPNIFLYKSDIAFFFFKIVNSFLAVKNSEINSFITNYQKKEDKNTSNDVTNQLSAVLLYCQTANLNDKITDDQDQDLNGLLTNYIKPIANFFLLDVFGSNDEDDGDEKTDKEGTDEKEGHVIDLDFEDETKRTSSGKKATDKSEDGDSINETKTPRPTKDIDPIRPLDPLKTKELLFSKELRRQAVNFSQIALVQLEIKNGLPPGTLQNSGDLKSLLGEKTTGFFLTVIGDGKHKDLTDPETRLKLVREYIWLIQNDFRTTAIISNHVTDILKTNSDPAIKKQIEESLVKAETDTDIAPLIKDLADNLQVKEIIKSLSSDKLVNGDTEYLTKETNELLVRELQNLGISTDKITLAQTNVTNVIDSFISQGFPLEILQYMDEGRFKIIFGDEIPYRAAFVESLEEVWIARRSIIGRKTGQILLHNEARFATQEALSLLDDQKKVVSKKEADGVFAHAIAAPTARFQQRGKIISSSPEEIIGFSYGKVAVTDREKKTAFLKNIWDTISVENRETVLIDLGYGEAGSNTIQNIINDAGFVPPDLGLHTLALANGSYDQAQTHDYGDSYIPANGQLKNPLAGVRNFQKNSKNRLGKLKKTAKKIKKKLGKKAAEKAANKIAEEGLSKAAGATAGAVNPALGIIAKLGTTKKGRRLLAAGGAVGLMSLIVPLMSWGGRIGAAVGGVIGGLVGGPGGAVAGAIAGGWTGYGLEQGLSKLFGSSASRPNIIQPRGKPGFPGAEAFKGAPKGAETGLAKAGFGTTFQPTDFIGQTITTIGGQAVLGTVAVLAGGNLMMRAIETGALLADFPIVEPLGAISANENKASKFVNIEKRAFIAGCPENKCENPAFPVEVEYTIVIKPKGNFTIQIVDASDTLKTFTSKKAWEEEGKTPPTVPERVKTLVEFTELYEGIIIEPGEEITLSYSETLDETHNHASINNTFKLKVFGSDPETGEEGTDEAITGEVIYLGDYSQGAGCWPASGTIKQLPGGTYSHKKVDAYDISTKAGGPIFTPFEGEACVANLDPGYGNHITIISPEGTFVYGHFASIGFSGCKTVIPGDFLGMMGTTGDSSGVHLHFERRGGLPSILETLMPSGDSIQYNDQVRTCYAQ